jgi:hypothetical protein
MSRDVTLRVEYPEREGRVERVYGEIRALFSDDVLNVFLSLLDAQATLEVVTTRELDEWEWRTVVKAWEHEGEYDISFWVFRPNGPSVEAIGYPWS